MKKEANLGRKLTMLWGVITILAGTGCTAESPLGNTGNGDEPVPIRINATMDEGTVTRGPKPITTAGAVVKLTALDATGTGIYPHRYNVSYTYNGYEWTSTAPIMLYPTQTKVVAYYDPNNITKFGYNTTTDIAVSEYADNKLWYYDEEQLPIDYNNPGVIFILQCAYSRLSLTLRRSPAYLSSCKISQIKIQPSSGTFYTTAKIDILDGSLSGTAASNYILDTSAKALNTTGLAVDKIDTSIDLLFPVQKLADGSGLTFTLTVDGRNYSVTVPAAKFNGFRRGVRHNIYLEMTSFGLQISGASSESWATGKDITGQTEVPL